MSKKRIITVVIIAVLWFGTFISSKPLKSEKSNDFWIRERVTAVISSPDIIPFLLGFETVFSNYLWIKTVLYTGENMVGDNNGVWLKDMILSINMLNPQFYPPYEFAAVMLPGITNSPEASRLILEKGISHIEGVKKRFMYFYLGWIYYENYQDYVRAADLFAYAAKDPKSPPHWARLSATALKEAGRVEQGVVFLLDLYENSDDPYVKRSLHEKITDLYKENKNELTFEIPQDFLEKEYKR